MSKSWPFDQPPSCATITTKHIMNDGYFIAHVHHDEDDHGWQFHYAGEKSMEDMMLVALAEVVSLDDTLFEVADLPPGWKASRASKEAPWKRVREDADYPEIIIDWSEIKSVEEFYERVLPQCQSPDWHGRNLDALTDSWVAGGINDLGPPYRFRFVGRGAIRNGLEGFSEEVTEIVRESIEENGGSSN